MNTKISIKQKNVLTTTLIIAILAISSFAMLSEVKAVEPDWLNPETIPKYTNQLVIPPVYAPTYSIDWKNYKLVANYKVDMSEFYEQILPSGTPGLVSPDGLTKVWGYGGMVKVPGCKPMYVRNSPGPTFEAIRGIPIKVTWTNNIATSSMFAVDDSLMIADPSDGTVPLVTHLHGGEVAPTSDGGPESWWTASGLAGPTYSTNGAYAATASGGKATYYYPNEQLPTTLWYHDHAMGLTRINVMSGLAGFYLLRDPLNPLEYKLPSGKYDIPLAIQDRIFNTDGSMWFPTEGNNPSIHPNWQPEFFGNTIMVNGKVWPNLNVDKGQYRFRLLDGSNARFYNLTFEVQPPLTDPPTPPTLLPFIQIGTDGGFLKSAAPLTSLLVAPGERADVLVDFSTLKPGDKVILKNDAAAPYPDGMAGDPLADPATSEFKATVGQIMQFKVQPTIGRKAAVLPTVLNPTLATPLPNTAGTKRFLTLTEVNAKNPDTLEMVPEIITLNGQKYNGALTETPRVGSTEDWYIINLTPDTHPIHLHLTQFQLVSRTPFSDGSGGDYKTAWLAQQDYQGPLPFPDTYIPTSLNPSGYTTGVAQVLTANEKAWKDTVQCPPGTVTVLRVRFAPQDSPLTGPRAPTPGANKYSFDPTFGSYVWHCHIIDHEDNEMMRPYTVVP